MSIRNVPTGLFDSSGALLPVERRRLIDGAPFPRCKLSRVLGLLSTLCVVPPITLANPEGGQVAAGAASIQQTSPSRVDVVQGSDRAVIDWQGFSIDQGEHTNFQQPSASSVALNRVHGADPSRIDGRLTANGNVYLVNRNGVVFGAGAKVDVAGLVATTADISNENFMQGRDVFDRPSDNPNAQVVNRGRIEVDEGGAVVLAAPRVSNEGEIKARLGRVALAGAETFTVDFHGDGLLQFDVGSEVRQAPSDGESGEALVSNTGTIIADGGVVEMSARTQDAVVEQVINMDGVIQARSVASVGGKIILSGGGEGIVAVSGKLDASGPEAGQTGGEVKVLGDKVGLFAGTEIDASGDAGGGEVLVGGNFQGKGPETNAKRTYVDEQASIKADAIDEGDGGTVVVWSDEVTDYRGEISARGGENGGDGRFVEVSGKQALGFEGDVSVGADHGDTGTVLLDPQNITIADTGATVPEPVPDTPDPDIGDPQVFDSTIAFTDGGTADFQISDEALEGLDGDIVLQAFNNIVVNESLELMTQQTGESVVLQAGRDIDINADITTNGASLHLEADSPHSGAADGIGAVFVLSTFGGDQDLTISTNGGDISLILGSAGVAGGIGISNTSLINAGSGAIQIAQSISGGTFQFGDVVLSESIGILNAAKLARIQTSGAMTLGQATTAGTNGLGTGAQTLVAGSLNVIEPFAFNGSTTLTAATDIGLNAAISGSSQLILQPSDPATAIGVGLDTAGFDLTPQELANLSNGFSQITIGRADGTHTFTINEASFSDPIVFQYPNGGGATVTSSGQTAGLSGTDDASFTFQGPGPAGATVNLNADVVTSGSPITINDSVQLGADVLLNTTDDAAGANIAITGQTNGANALTLTAGTGAINLGVVGDVTPLTGLAATSMDTNVQNVTTQGAQSYTGNTTFNGAYLTNGGSFGVNGNALLAAGPIQVTTQGGDITYAGNATFNGTYLTNGGSFGHTGNVVLAGATQVTTQGGALAFSGTTNGANTLDLNAGTGAINVGVVGDTTALTGLTATGATLGLQNVTTQGAQSYNGVSTFNGTYLTNGGSFGQTGNAVIAGATQVTTQGGALTFSGSTNGANTLDLNAGMGAINLGVVGDTTSLTGLTATGATLGLQDVTTQGAQDYTGNVTFNSSYATNGGNFTVNGDAVLASVTDITTNGGNVTFGGALNGTNPLTISAGAGGNISFNGDVGLVNPLQAVNVTSGQDVLLNGRFVAGDTRLAYSGAASSALGSLDVSTLFLDPGATSATVFGTVAGASGTDAALAVTGPVNDPDFTINGCVIGVSCVDLPITPTPTPTPDTTTTIPPAVDPITPQPAQSSTEKNVVQEAAATTTPNTPTLPMLAVNIRRPPSADPTTPQYSNFGNEELWNRRRNESEEE